MKIEIDENKIEEQITALVEKKMRQVINAIAIDALTKSIIDRMDDAAINSRANKQAQARMERLLDDSLNKRLYSYDWRVAFDKLKNEELSYEEIRNIRIGYQIACFIKNPKEIENYEKKMIEAAGTSLARGFRHKQEQMNTLVDAVIKGVKATEGEQE